jgi:signal transduction histidine kinase
VVVLLVGLGAGQGLSALILFYERGQVLYQASGVQTATRFAEIVRLLEASPRGERARLVSVLNTPRLQVELRDEPLPDSSFDDGGSGADSAFSASLQRQLGARNDLRVRIWGSDEETGWPRTPPGGRWGMHGGQGMGPMHPTDAIVPAGVTYLAEVSLPDGQWVTFRHRLHEDTFAGTTRVLVGLALLLLTVVALSLVAVRWVTRPLSTLAHAADALGRDLRRAPLPETGPEESRRAAQAFNAMQAQIGRYIEDRTRVLTAVSHDLKTPLTRLRLRAELVDDEALRESILRDLDEMLAMTHAALDFLRGLDSREQAAAMDVDAMLETLKADAEDAGNEVALNGTAAGPYTGRPLALKRCIGNLLDNALKFGASARISVRDTAQALTIEIADDGPGIPNDELERVFEPYYRVEASRSRDTGGSGLGLSIARGIARAHGGDVTLRNGDRGGLIVTVTLPRGS